MKPKRESNLFQKNEGKKLATNMRRFEPNFHAINTEVPSSNQSTQTSKKIENNQLVKNPSTEERKIPNLKSLLSTKTDFTTVSEIKEEEKLKHQTKPVVSSTYMFNYLNEESQQRRENSRRGQTQEELWNRRSQIGTQSRIMKQYERYFSDDENIFYEDSSMIKELETIKWCWKKILIIFVFNALFFFAIWSITPYGKPCPKHATCGAYINCHEGYILDEQLEYCQVDPEVTELALALMSSVVEDMKIEYGEKECTASENFTEYELKEHLNPPRMNLKKIFQKLNIESEDFRLLRTEVARTFRDKNNQLLANFAEDEMNRMYPLEKKYTITCKMDLFYKHHFVYFLFIVFFIILLIIYASFQLSKWIFNKKGKTIYEYLKAETIEKKQINFDDYKTEIEEKFNNKKPMSEELFVLINDFRIKEKIIGCYESHEGINGKVVWKSLKSL